MPDSEGRLLLDSEGREILDAEGREACECCGECDCPEGLPTAYLLEGHIEQGPPAPQAQDCHQDFFQPLEGEEGTCNYSGTFDCPTGLGSGSLHPFTLQRVGTAQGYPSCGWALGFSDGSTVFKAGNDPTGAYPDHTIFNAFGEPTVHSNLVVS